MGNKISVIMLTYNREDLVRRAIESILCQTMTDFEYIIVDNGSSDRSGDIAEEYAKQDNRIKVVHIPKSNIGTGRNAGLDLATGEYITFIDDDDTAEPDMLEFLYNLVVENGAEVAICASEKEEKGKSIFIGIPSETKIMDAENAIITLMWRKYYNTGFPTKLFKSVLFDGIRFPKEEKYDDIFIMYKVLANAKKVVYQGSAKYHVYRHLGNNSAITTNDNMMSSNYLRDYRKAYRERTIWLCKMFPEKKEYWWYFDWSFLLSMTRKVIENKILACDEHVKEMRAELNENKERFQNSPYLQDFEKEWIKEFIK